MFVVAFNLSLLLASEVDNMLLTQTELQDSSTAKELRELLKNYKTEVTKTASEVKTSTSKLDQEVKKLNSKVLAAERKAREVEAKSKAIKLGESEIKDLLERGKKYVNQHRSSDKWSNMYSPNGAKIYQNVNDAFRKGVVKKVGNPRGWHTHHLRYKWYGQYMIRIGYYANSYKNGIQINVPSGYDVIWIRCSNHVWGRFNVSREENGKRIPIGVFTCGYRRLQYFCPDGGSADSYSPYHSWTPIAVGKSGKYFMNSEIYCDGWISGFAFTKNLWNHAYNSSVAYHWHVNGGDYIYWSTNLWNNDNLARINYNTVRLLKVPVVSNGKDKLLYFNEHNNSWTGVQHLAVTVNGKSIERFRTTYSNPFQTHFSGKSYTRYVAAFVPKSLIKEGQTLLDVRIDMRVQNNYIYFREMGTHDYE